MAESGDGACVQAALLDVGQDPVAVRPLWAGTAQQPQSMEEKVRDSEKPNTLEKVEGVTELYGFRKQMEMSCYSQIQATVLWQLLLGCA